MNGKLYIGGKFCEAADGATFDVVNPYNLKKIGEQAAATKADVVRAIDFAETGFASLKALTAHRRADLLRKLYAAMLANEKEIAETMTEEQGKPLKEAIGEVRYAASYVQWYAEEGIRVQGDILAPSSSKMRLHVLREPVGPVALITPWNFPLAMMVRKLAPAIAAGCSVIAKPAGQTPFTAVKFFQLIDQVGFPEGSCQLLTGSAELIGEVLLDDFRIRKLSFTGSTEVGKRLAQKSAATLKRVSMELGGHAPLIIFSDADIKKAVKGAVLSKYLNSGQACIASNRLYVHTAIKADFVAALTESVRGLKVGNGMENADIGPVIDQNAYQKIALHVDDACAKGGKVLTGGQGYRAIDGAGGYLYPATLLDDVDDQMLIVNEETFGPVLPILTFEDDDDVIRRANATPYGLAAYAYTESLTRATKVMESLEFGMIGINTPGLGAVQTPFGGVKMSGYGREGGKYGIEEYLQTKIVNIGL
ncbi:MAG: succinate-semialdehyde dehydrogenase (NADP(+)) [Clostridiales bacterium]|nr:MAG: succinate-semialdehyde dehydrogenase (NADP(+)) [Clostridiales bacterium]